nr:tetratricopeptide repeat protein [Bacteroidota bacterium]
MAVVYWDKGNYPEALKHNYIALKMYDAIGAKTNIAGCYNNIGILYSEQNKPKDALPNYEKSPSIIQRIKRSKRIADYIS